MSVYKPKGSPFYHFDFEYQRNRFHGSTRQTERRAAEAVERDERERVKTVAKVATPGMSLDQAAQRYWHEVAQHQVGADNAKHDLAFLIDYFCKERRLDTITGDDITKLVAWRRGHRVPTTGKLVNSGTVDRTTKMLRRLFTYAKEAWHLRFDREPIWRTHLIDRPQERERLRELQSHEGERLDAVLRDDYRPLFDYAQATGQRKTACYALQWSQVNWDTREIIRPRAKRGRPNVVPITDEIRAILWPLRGHHQDFVFTYVVQRTGSGRVRGGRLPITLEGLHSHWKWARSKAGLSNFRFHDFRHTFATALLRDSGNIRIVQQALGHQDIRTTARYAHVLNQDLAAATDRLQKSRKKSRTALREVS
jgi:integrase